MKPPLKKASLVTALSLSLAFKGNLLLAELDTLEIERWDRENIITRPKSEGICGEHVMSINRAIKSVDALITRRGESGLCDGFPKEQRLRLGNGQ